MTVAVFFTTSAWAWTIRRDHRILASDSFLRAFRSAWIVITIFLFCVEQNGGTRQSADDLCIDVLHHLFVLFIQKTDLVAVKVAHHINHETFPVAVI